MHKSYINAHFMMYVSAPNQDWWVSYRRSIGILLTSGDSKIIKRSMSVYLSVCIVFNKHCTCTTKLVVTHKWHGNIIISKLLLPGLPYKIIAPEAANIYTDTRRNISSNSLNNSTWLYTAYLLYNNKYRSGHFKYSLSSKSFVTTWYKYLHIRFS